MICGLIEINTAYKGEGFAHEIEIINPYRYGPHGGQLCLGC